NYEAKASYAVTASVADAALSGSTPVTVSLTLSVTDINEPPALLAGSGDITSASLVENNLGLTAAGTLSVSDGDGVGTLTLSVQSVAASGTTAGLVPTNSALAAMLSLNTGSLAGAAAPSGTMGWNFNSGTEAFNFLAEGETLSLTYTIAAVDNQPARPADTELVTITITGANDAPNIQVTGSNSATAILTESNAGLFANGTLSVRDEDRSNAVSVAVRSVSASGASTAAGLSDTALLAMLKVNRPAEIISSTSTTGTINWTFDSGTEAFDALAAGETLTLAYTLRVTDSNGIPATDDQIVTITLNGTNDTPLLSVAAGDRDSATLNETNTTLTASGTLSVTDADRSDSLTASVQQVSASGATTGLAISNAALLGMLSVTRPAGNTGTSATINWAFNSNSEAFDQLAAGERLTLAYVVQVTDSSGTQGADNHVVQITIDGSNDAPVISIGTENQAAIALTESNAALSGTGRLTVTERDLANSVIAALLAMLSVIDPAVIAGNSIGSGAIDWRFHSDSESFNHLAAGETLTLTYLLKVIDSNGAPASDVVSVTVTITGTNDA
ncbi:MAG: hypothetical protein EBT33_22420, partial [Betaproteobacteria bacterium]|nr:hypothetical protein [Betaproteobacteria bacterium]